jgi:hypothetical protein
MAIKAMIIDQKLIKLFIIDVVETEIDADAAAKVT